mmetsp:Transcript_5013/g.14030  ORF Transcript_5013/g.14030 Transcript_5013/m.14030 type:complete len:330 (-) Transcript_5013:297-1286(-)
MLPLCRRCALKGVMKYGYICDSDTVEVSQPDFYHIRIHSAATMLVPKSALLRRAMVALVVLRGLSLLANFFVAVGAEMDEDYFSDKEPSSTIPITLTEDNLIDVTAGKTTLIYFWATATSCVACEDLTTSAILPLARDWQDSPTGVVAQVNCEADESSAVLCDDYGVETFPTILYGDALSPEVYDEVVWNELNNDNGNNDNNDIDYLSYQALSTLAQQHLSKPPCNVANLQESCSPNVQATLKELLAKSRDELEELEIDIDSELAEVEVEYDEALAQINEQFQAALDTYNAKMQRIRHDRHYKWVQMVLAETDRDLEALHHHNNNQDEL